MILFADGFEGGNVERRIVAAEVALEDRLPGIALSFLSRIDRDELRAASRAARDRFLRVARRSSTV